jgi:hypothetical protein
MRLTPDGWLAAGLRGWVFLLPVLLEALVRVDALLRLREGEDARVAMERRLGDPSDDAEPPRRPADDDPSPERKGDGSFPVHFPPTKDEE